MALKEKLSVTDEIKLQLTPQPKVYCGSCKKHVCYLGNKIKPICPLCCNYFYVLTDGKKMIKTSEGYLPWNCKAR